MQMHERIRLKPVPARSVSTVDHDNLGAGLVDQRVGEGHSRGAASDDEVVGFESSRRHDLPHIIMRGRGGSSTSAVLDSSRAFAPLWSADRSEAAALRLAGLGGLRPTITPMLATCAHTRTSRASRCTQMLSRSRKRTSRLTERPARSIETTARFNRDATRRPSTTSRSHETTFRRAETSARFDDRAARFELPTSRLSERAPRFFSASCRSTETTSRHTEPPISKCLDARSLLRDDVDVLRRDALQRPGIALALRDDVSLLGGNGCALRARVSAIRDDVSSFLGDIPVFRAAPFSTPTRPLGNPRRRLVRPGGRQLDPRQPQITSSRRLPMPRRPLREPRRRLVKSSGRRLTPR